MKMTLNHQSYRIDKNKYGGKVTVSITQTGTMIQTCVFTYGDPHYDYCETRKEAEQAALNYMNGAKAMFQLLKSRMTLDLTDYNALLKRKAIT